jgi:CheY-like chemotaxis protein
LGLTITKKLIQLQGGDINVSSKEGKGSNFIFHLKYDVVNIAKQQFEKIAREQSVSNLDGLKVLVVEDNKVNTIILTKFLTKWNVKIDTAQNGKEAIDKVQENDFDLVLMDLHMPIMDGKEATSIIRANANEKISKLPIIALTADATNETQIQILSLGFNEYVTKPFEPKRLYAVLEGYIKN